MLRADRILQAARERRSHRASVTFSILAMRFTSIVAFFPMRADVPRGTCPARSNAAQAASSTASHISYLRFNSQMAFILGRV